MKTKIENMVRKFELGIAKMRKDLDNGVYDSLPDVDGNVRVFLSRPSVLVVVVRDEETFYLVCSAMDRSGWDGSAFGIVGHGLTGIYEKEETMIVVSGPKHEGGYDVIDYLGWRSLHHNTGTPDQ